MAAGSRWAQWTTGNALVLHTKSKDWQGATEYRKETDVGDNTRCALVCVVSAILDLRNLTRTTGEHTTHSPSAAGHDISRDSSPASLYCAVTAKSPKEGPGWPGWLPQVGVSDPTLWELLTSELLDLLDITGLRGGLPGTNVLLFKSA